MSSYRDKRARLTGRASFRKFAGIPFDVMDSMNYKRLSVYAKALLLDMRRQFTGRNNGDLDCRWARLQEQACWRSKETLYNALSELLHYGFIERTRKGKRIGGKHFPSLYAITWEPIHDMPDKGINGTPVASGKWRQSCDPWERPVRRRRETPRPERVVGKSASRTWGAEKRAFCGVR